MLLKRVSVCVLCVGLTDEINWPTGEDTPPADSQELITLLLRQNPMERMGTGTGTPYIHAHMYMYTLVSPMAVRLKSDR